MLLFTSYILFIFGNLALIGSSANISLFTEYSVSFTDYSNGLKIDGFVITSEESHRFIAHICIIDNSIVKDNLTISVSSTNPDIVTVSSVNSTLLCLFEYNDNTCCNVTIESHGRFLGKAWIILWGHADRNSNATKVFLGELRAIITRPQRVIDTIFIVVVALFVFFATVTFGCKVDLAIVKSILLRPVGPIIGFFSQYVLMPLLALGILQVLSVNKSIDMGLFALGCSPGGGGSNVWTVLLNGDLDLSLTMTFISTAASFVMMPAWLYSLGHLFLEQNIVIPFQNIFTSLFTIVIALFIGILIRRYKPQTADKIAKHCVRPTALTFVIFVFTFGIWANLYIFPLMADWRIILGGLLLPWLGIIFGALAAWIGRQPWKRTLTIAIETSVQNTGIPIVLMRLSLPQPDADISSVYPVACAIFTPVPFGFALLFMTLYRKYRSSDEATSVSTGVCFSDDNSGSVKTGDSERIDDEEEEVTTRRFICDTEQKTDALPISVKQITESFQDPVIMSIHSNPYSFFLAEPWTNASRDLYSISLR